MRRGVLWAFCCINVKQPHWKYSAVINFMRRNIKILLIIVLHLRSQSISFLTMKKLKCFIEYPDSKQIKTFCFDVYFKLYDCTDSVISLFNKQLLYQICDLIAYITFFVTFSTFCLFQQYSNKFYVVKDQLFCKFSQHMMKWTCIKKCNKNNLYFDFIVQSVVI